MPNITTVLYDTPGLYTWSWSSLTDTTIDDIEIYGCAGGGRGSGNFPLTDGEGAGGAGEYGYDILHRVDGDLTIRVGTANNDSFVQQGGVTKARFIHGSNSNARTGALGGTGGVINDTVHGFRRKGGAGGNSIGVGAGGGGGGTPGWFGGDGADGGSSYANTGGGNAVNGGGAGPARSNGAIGGIGGSVNTTGPPTVPQDGILGGGGGGRAAGSATSPSANGGPGWIKLVAPVPTTGLDTASCCCDVCDVNRWIPPVQITATVNAEPVDYDYSFGTDPCDRTPVSGSGCGTNPCDSSGTYTPCCSFYDYSASWADGVIGAYKLYHVNPYVAIDNIEASAVGLDPDHTNVEALLIHGMTSAIGSANIPIPIHPGKPDSSGCCSYFWLAGGKATVPYAYAYNSPPPGGPAITDYITSIEVPYLIPKSPPPVSGGTWANDSRYSGKCFCSYGTLGSYCCEWFNASGTDAIGISGLNIETHAPLARLLYPVLRAQLCKTGEYRIEFEVQDLVFEEVTILRDVSFDLEPGGYGSGCFGHQADWVYNNTYKGAPYGNFMGISATLTGAITPPWTDAKLLALILELPVTSTLNGFDVYQWTGGSRLTDAGCNFTGYIDCTYPTGTTECLATSTACSDTHYSYGAMTPGTITLS